MAAKKPKWTPDRIRKLIERSGARTQREFAERIGVSDQLVSAWLSGERTPTGVYNFALDTIEEKTILQVS